MQSIIVYQAVYGHGRVELGNMELSHERPINSFERFKEITALVEKQGHFGATVIILNIIPLQTEVPRPKIPRAPRP